MVYVVIKRESWPLLRKPVMCDLLDN